MEPDPHGHAAPCASCGAEMSGHYCAACGEPAVHEGDLRLSHLLHDFLHEFTHLDGKIWRTLAALLFLPGKLTREYWEGRRGLWVRPLRLYLVISALQLLLASGSSGPLGLRIWAYQGADGKPSYSVGSRPMNGQASEPVNEELSHSIQKYYLWIRYSSVLLFAGASWLLCRKSQLYYGAHLIFALHFYSFEYVLNGLTARLEGAAITTVTILLGLMWLHLALRRLYHQSWWKTAVKMLLLFQVVAIAESLLVVGALLIAIRFVAPHH